MNDNRAFGEHIEQLGTLARGVPRIAFFDLDRTLVAGYTMTAFVFEQARRGLLSPGQLARQSLNYVQYGRARIGFERLIADAAADFAGRTLVEVEGFAREIFEQHVEPQIFREARNLVERHRTLGHRLVMVTSATQFQALPVARRLGIDQVCCTRLEIRRGILTGRLAGKPCFGRSKVTAARRAACQARTDIADCFFYSDSPDDLPLLEIVGHPCAVNPSPELAERAAKRAWPRLYFTSRTEPNFGGALRTGMVCQALLAAAAAGGIAWLGKRSPQEARSRMMQVLGELGTGLAGLDLEVAGGGNLGAARPAVFIFNHQSYIDALVLARLVQHDLAAFCKQEIGSMPVLGPLMRAAGAIFVDRESPDAAREPLRLGLEALRQGRSLAVAPEGTRSADERLGRFKHGAFVLARKAGVPVVPVVLHNTADAMPRGSLQVHPTTVRVTVLPALEVSRWPTREIGAEVRNVESRYREVLAG